MYASYTPEAAAAASIGEIFELRDFTPYLPKGGASEESRPDKWRLLPYRLLDGTLGKLLFVSAKSPSPPVFDGSGLPPEIAVPLPGKGRFRVSFGIPLLKKGPTLAGPGAAYGMDAALDGKPFTGVFLEFGLRYGRVLEEYGREIFCLYREMDCHGGSLRLRVPFGAFQSLPLGYVRGVLSSIRFQRVEAPSPSDEEKKPLIVVQDGFSHYFSFGNRGEFIDARLPEVYQNSDVKIIMAQTHGAVTWKSRITSYFGENLTDKNYEGKRAGDRRLGEYVSWAVNQGEGPMALQAELCHKYGMEFHYSLRANLFFPANNHFTPGEGRESERFINGDWWVDHPEARIPGSHKIDYQNPLARAYVLGLFEEVMTLFDVDGVNLDLTRWPPVMDVKRHSPQVLIGFVKELRALADRIAQEKCRTIRLSLTMVDGFHANRSLEEQKIDLEGLLKTGCLDFVCIQAHDLAPHCALARQYGVACYGVQDGDSPYWPGGWREDPLWRLPDNSVQDDPVAGEEFKDQPDLRCCLTPQELNLSMDRMYTAGADGIYLVNHFFGNRTLRDGGSPEKVHDRVRSGEVYGQEKGQYLFLLES